MSNGQLGKILFISAVVTLILVVVGVIFMAFTMGGYGWRGMMGLGMMGFAMDLGGVGLGWILPWMILSLVFLVAGIYLLVTGLSGRRRGYAPSRPIEILKERYARGEITEEEFIKMKRDLE